MKAKNENENEQEAHLVEEEDGPEEQANEIEGPHEPQDQVNQIDPEPNQADDSDGTTGVDDANLRETAGVDDIKITGVPNAEMVTEEDSDDEEDVAVEMDCRYGPQSHGHDL